MLLILKLMQADYLLLVIIFAPCHHFFTLSSFLQDNPLNYDKGILAEILEPIMGKGLIPADPETWKVRRKAIVPGFHKAWLNAMVISRILSFASVFCLIFNLVHLNLILPNMNYGT